MADRRGLYGKYFIDRTDGSSEPGGKHSGCRYFILDLTHDRHASAALRAYADSCATDKPALYDDLNDMLAQMEPHYYTCSALIARDMPCSGPAVIPLGNGCWFCVEHARAHVRHPHGRLCDAGAASLARRTALSAAPAREKEE